MPLPPSSLSSLSSSLSAARLAARRLLRPARRRPRSAFAVVVGLLPSALADALPLIVAAGRRRAAAWPASTASSNASCSSGVTSDFVSLMSGWISSALRNCLMPTSRCLKPDDRDDAEVDVRARGDRVLVETGARADLERLLQQRARRVVVLLAVGVERLLVQVRDLVDRRRVARRGGGGRRGGRRATTRTTASNEAPTMTIG